MPLGKRFISKSEERTIAKKEKKKKGLWIRPVLAWTPQHIAKDLPTLGILQVNNVLTNILHRGELQHTDRF